MCVSVTSSVIKEPRATLRAEMAEMLAVKYLACRRDLSTVWYLEVLWGCWEGPTAYSTVL